MPDIRRICLSRLKFIGDIVLTTPLIRAIRERYPDAYLAYLGDKKAVTLLQGNPFLDEVIPYDFSRPDFLEQIRVGFLLRKRRLDVFIDLFSNPRSALLARASGARIRIGRDVPGRGSLYTHRMPDFGSMTPAIDFHFGYLEPIGVPGRKADTEIFLSEDELREARIFLRHQDVDPGRPLVALHPGATWPNKRWQAERFAALADLLRAKLGAEILLSPGPGDEALMSDILGKTAGVIHLLPVLPVRQLASVFAVCRLLISNDCGPMHIGAAVGTPTFGIFGPEPPEVWFPYSRERGHRVFYSRIECAPCRVTSCHRDPSHYLECMTRIPVEEVFSEAEQLLGRRSR
ncbi:MAG TPA: glycosyltransferase family 9 protein [Bacteroidota bacterium]|nr:glycosyltransferase family 9 protein [Bacteroidota bacterium]